MLRVIRTELYVDPYEIGGRSPEPEQPPGISVAFFHGKPEKFGFQQVLSNPVRVVPHLDELIPFFYTVLHEAPIFPWDPPHDPTIRTIFKIFRERVIIERSPPVAIPLGKLLTGASLITVGTFVGIKGMSVSPLMFAAVPAGILVVGAPIVVLNAINRWIDRLLSKDQTPTETETTKTTSKKKKKKKE
jgi:hypothetical protein